MARTVGVVFGLSVLFTIFCFEGSKMLHPVIYNWFTHWQTVNQWVKSTVKVGGRFSDLRGFRASVPSPPPSPSPSPLPRLFCSRPIFRTSWMRKLLLAVLYFVRLVRERLLRRQILPPISPIFKSNFRFPSRFQNSKFRCIFGMIIVSLDVRTGNIFVFIAIWIRVHYLRFRAKRNYFRAIRSPPPKTEGARTPMFPTYWNTSCTKICLGTYEDRTKHQLRPEMQWTAFRETATYILMLTKNSLKLKVLLKLSKAIYSSNETLQN